MSRKSVKQEDGSPEAYARLRDAAGWAGEMAAALIEFELESRNLLLHGHDVRGS
jgi:hypothetical protein